MKNSKTNNTHVIACEKGKKITTAAAAAAPPPTTTYNQRWIRSKNIILAY